MNTPRLFISAAHKSSGKTTISIGLCAALHKLGKKVAPFKKGPDYIDPIWLSHAAGQACYNLDFYTAEANEILQAINDKSHNADIAIIEGNKGLYDGLDLDGSNSNAALAVLSQTPVVLVIDSRGMTRGIAPLILGYQAFDQNINIAGVILNNVGGTRHESKLQNVIEHYTDVPVIGAVHKNDKLHLLERHLGLQPGNEHDQVNQKIATIGEIIASQVNMDAVMKIATTAKEYTFSSPAPTPNGTSLPTIRIAIARDSVFNFYYQNDLDAFFDCSAELIEFDTLSDKSLPANIDGLFIGGGFPETQMKLLAANRDLIASIKMAVETGLPCYAECGGLMYLSNSIKWRGKKEQMAGIIQSDTIMHDKPQGRGYVRMEKTRDHPWLVADETLDDKSDQGLDYRESNTISAHEFHYSSLENVPESTIFAFNVLRGTGINGKHDGIVYKNLFASYTHQRNTRSNPWVKHFTDFIRRSL